MSQEAPNNLPANVAQGLNSLPEAVVQALMHGDLSALNHTERLALYHQTCASIGLNPLTNPLSYLELPGQGGKKRLVLYASKGCTDQLRKLHSITESIVSRVIEDDLCVVMARSSDATGRIDEDYGIVSLIKEGGTWQPGKDGKNFFRKDGTFTALRGEERANAIKKAITQAKRRSTLSFCGLGMLDESEVGGLQDAVVVTVAPGEIASPAPQALVEGVKLADSPEHMKPVKPARPAKADKVDQPKPTAPEEIPVPMTYPPVPSPTEDEYVAFGPTEPVAPVTTPEDTTVTRKPIASLNQQECIFRLQDEIKRICGSGQAPEVVKARTELLMNCFGSAIDKWAAAIQLGKSALQRGLLKMKDLPDYGATHAYVPVGEVYIFDGPVDESESSVVTDPDKPRIVDGYVSEEDEVILESWCRMMDQEDCYKEMTAQCPKEGSHLCITARLHERIIAAVKYRNDHKE